MNLATRLGGMLVAPRALLRHLPERTGTRDGAALLGLYTLAIALPALGRAIAGALALGDVLGLLQGLVPLIPWLVAGLAVEWLLGPARAHRTALCMVPLLLVAAAAHLLDVGGPRMLGPADLATFVGAAASLALALAVRAAIPTRPDERPAPASTNLSPGPAAASPGDLSPGPSSASPTDLAPAPAATDLSPGPASASPTDLSPGPASAHSTNLSPGPAFPARPATLAGLVLLVLVAASAARDARELALAWPSLAPLAPGEPLPPVRLRALEGGSFALDELPPVPHVFVFWTTWCGVCEREMPMLRAIHRRWADQGLRLVLVNADASLDQAALTLAYRDRHALEDMHLALDPGPAREALRVRMYPHFIFVDDRGDVVHTHQGSLGEPSLESAIEKAFHRR